MGCLGKIWFFLGAAGKCFLIKTKLPEDAKCIRKNCCGLYNP